MRHFPSRYGNSPSPTYTVSRGVRTHGERLAQRRNQIADMWSGRHDGRCWTAQQIADEIGLQLKGVYGHLRLLRDEGDPRGFRKPEVKNHSPFSPIRILEAAE